MGCGRVKYEIRRPTVDYFFVGQDTILSYKLIQKAGNSVRLLLFIQVHQLPRS